MAGVLLVHGATGIDAASATPDMWIAVDVSGIVATGTGDSWSTDFADVKQFDVTGLTVIPGLVDMHTHGAMGLDWARATVTDAGTITQAHRIRGTTSMVGSIMTDTQERTVRALEAMRELMASNDRVWGAHLEGPCLAVGRKGAHREDLLREPTSDIVDILLDFADVIAQVTIAPELHGAMSTIEKLVETGIVVAIGHTEASAEVVTEAFKRGASVVTHAFNGMRGIAGRDPGPVGVALAQPHVTLEVIGDGIHVDPRVVAFLCEAAPGRVALVSDSLPTLGLPDGTYAWAEQQISVVGDTGTIAGTATLAGSVASLLQGVRTAVDAGVEPVAAVAAASAVPAAAMGRDPHAHRLRPGALPDLVIVDDRWHVTSVVAAGEVV